jgi:hypothetical protein
MVGNESQSRYGWKAEVGVFFGGISADSSEDERRRIAPDHPVFRIEQVSAPSQ